MKKLRKVLSITIVFVMVLSILAVAPVSTQAASVDDAETGYSWGTDVESDAMMYVGQTKYFSQSPTYNNVSDVTVSGSTNGVISYYRSGTGAYVTAIKPGTAKVKISVTSYYIGPNYIYDVKTNIVTWNITVLNESDVVKAAAPTVSVSNSADGPLVSWNKVANAEKYRVYYRRSTNTSWSSTITTNTYYKFRNFEPGILYYIQVQSVGEYGINGYYSAVKSVTYVPKTTISGLTYKGGNNTLTWDKTSGATNYQVARKKTGDSAYTYFTTSNTYLVEKNVQAGVTYTYQVRAMSGNAYGAWSPSRSVVTMIQPNLTVSNKSNGIRAEWTAVTGATKYIVYYKSELDSGWSSLETKNTYYPLLNTVTDRKYAFQVRPVGSGGSGPYSAVKNIVYAKPTNEKPVVTLSNKSNGVRVEWNAVKGADAYIVYYRRASDSTWSSVQTSNLYYPYLNAVLGTTYCFQVQPVFYGLKGAYSSVKSITFSNATNERPEVTLSNKSNGVRVEWNTVKGATSYIVYYRKASDSKWSSVETKNTYYPYLSAVSGTTYCFQVQTVFNGSKGAYSSVHTITFSNEKPEVTISGKSNSIRVEWNAVKGATSYIVYYKKALNSAWSSIETKNTYYTYLNTVSGTTYYFQVQAVFGDAKGASSSVWYITY